MSNLRTLFPDSNFSISGGSLATPLQLFVYNTSFTSVQNGGRCCLWTVPASVNWAKFEVWGGGGDGGGACCCQQGGAGGGSGSYARKTIRTVPGESYTICAAGSGCCSPNCGATAGFPSYVCNASATYPICLCASGGSPGCSGCFFQTNGCFSCATHICGSTCGCDFAIQGITGGHYDGVYCGFDGWQYAPGTTYQGGGMRIGFDYCNAMAGCVHIGAGSSFVGFGAGGGSASTSGGACCWGGWGSPGIVVVTYGG